MMRVYPIPTTEYDEGKFEARYKLQKDKQYSTYVINGITYVRLFDEVILEDKEPIFDKPDPPVVVEVKTKEELASEIVDLIGASLPKKDREAVRDKLLVLLDVLPPEVKQAP